MDALPSSRTTDQLKTLDNLRSGDLHRVHEHLDSFEGQARSKVQSIARSLELGSIEAASNEVLTDGTTWPILSGLLPDDTSAVNNLSAERPALRGIAAWRTLSGAVSRLWDWDWEGAVVEAKRCLLVARDEQTRDEALNLIACAEWEVGDDADAIAALSSALEGSYTEGLQVNIGVVAAGLEPRLAGQHLGKLAMQAPTLSMRASAASRALHLWYADPDPWDTEEGEHTLPSELRDALRQLVRSDVDEAAFVRFVKAAREQEMEFRRLKDLIKSAVTSYLITGKPTPLRDAVVMLEDAVRAEREQAREIDLVDIHPQAERLRVALEALPMRAREVFVTGVRERVEAGAPGHAPGRKIDQKLSSEEWFRKAWGSEWEPGPFFTPDLQSRYDHARQEANERRVEAEQHNREYRAAAAARKEARQKKAPVIATTDVAKAPTAEPTPVRHQPRRTVWTVEDPPTAADLAAMSPAMSASVVEYLRYIGRHDAERDATSQGTGGIPRQMGVEAKADSQRTNPDKSGHNQVPPR